MGGSIELTRGARRPTALRLWSDERLTKRATDGDAAAFAVIFERHHQALYRYCRAILRHACGGDPAKFRSFAARFSGTVFPGDTLITEGWRVEKGKYLVRCTTQTGAVVLTNATATVAD